MKTLKLIPLLFVILFVAACKPEEIKPPVSNDPVFTAEINIGEETINIEAGIEDALMTTFIEDINGVNKFGGRLGTSENYIEFGIMDGNLDLVNPYSEEALTNPLNFLATSSSPIMLISKDDLDNYGLINYINWSVNGDFVSVDSLAIYQPGVYQVCAEVHFNNQIVKSLCNEMIVGYSLNSSATVNHLIGVDNVLKAWIGSSSQDVTAVEWSVDGNVVSEDLALNYPLSSGQHYVEAEILFKSGALRKKRILVDADGLGLFIGDFSRFEENTSSQVNWNFAADIKIQHQGKTYVSSQANNTSASVQLSEISFYGKNPQGQNVYLCKGTIQANFKELGTGNIVPMSITTKFGIPLE